MPEPYSRMFPRVSACNPLSARVDIYKCRISVCLLSLAERICDGLKPLETGRVWADPAAAVCCARQHAVDSTLSSLPATHRRQLPLAAREPPFAAAPLARSHSCDQLLIFVLLGGCGLQDVTTRTQERDAALQAALPYPSSTSNSLNTQHLPPGPVACCQKAPWLRGRGHVGAASRFLFNPRHPFSHSYGHISSAPTQHTCV